MNKHDLALEDILNNDDCINDLLINPNSKYKNILIILCYNPFDFILTIYFFLFKNFNKLIFISYN
jgi:hypothetical protein